MTINTPQQPSAAPLKIEAIYTYPIKSFRGVSLPRAVLTQHGLPYDRRYMLLKHSSNGQHQPMNVTQFAEMGLFQTSLAIPDEQDLSTATVGVTYTSPEHGRQDTVTFPLDPDHSQLQTLTVNLHSSVTSARVMPAEACDWLSARFGYKVLLVHLDSHREVLGNLAPNAAQRNPKLEAKRQAESTWTGSTWSRLSRLVPGPVADGDQDKAYGITFADCAPYLVVSSTSVDNVSARLPDGMTMDETKFRPNIVVSGAPTAFEEDYWAELRINDDAVMTCTQNCLRCPSLNVDYATGTHSTEIQPLKLLQKDRRVDKDNIYKACFGRYSFLMGDEARNVQVGDAVQVTRRNTGPTGLKWPGWGGIPEDELYPV